MEFCSLYSGSSGNSIYVGNSRTRLLVDAGVTGKKVAEGLCTIGINPVDIDGIVITHEHIDHVKAAGILSRKYNIPIYANTKTWEAMSKLIGNVKDDNIKVFESYKPFEIKDIVVVPYPIPHDAAEPCGYSFISCNKKFSIATDIGYASNDVKNNIKDSDAILLESNHDVEMLKIGPYPYPLKLRILSNSGHLSNDDCGKTIVEILNSKTKHIFLGHLSKTNNYPELALRTVLSILESNGIRDGEDLNIDVANRDRASKMIAL